MAKYNATSKMPPQLTRYLYFLDECFYSLMFCLIRAHKSSLEEVVFWAGEIYYSGFIDSLWEHIWKIYYDFYAIKYPRYEKKINKLSNEPKSLKNIIYILNLLYYSKPTYDVFILRMMNPEAPSHVYFGRSPKWLKDLQLEKEENRLIRSIDSHKNTNIAFYINRTKDHQKTYDAIKKYYTKVHHFTLKSKTLSVITYKNKTHILLALICHLSLDISEIQTKTIFKKLNETLVVEQIKFNSDLIEPLYKTLVHKRLYKISPLIGAFKLERFSIEKINYKDVLRLYWDYFAYHTPIWQERIKNYNGVIDDKKCEVIFNNDNDHEAFYERYNYEPDEQSKDVQYKSICEINNDIGFQWLSSIINAMGIANKLSKQSY